jgi:hypothetical protein
LLVDEEEIGRRKKTMQVKSKEVGGVLKRYAHLVGGVAEGVCINKF